MRCALAIAVMAAAVAACADGQVEAGPLAFPRDAGQSWVGVPTGQFAVAGIPLTSGMKGRRLVLLRVEPAKPREARGARLRVAASTGAGLEIGSARGWKNKAWDLRPLPFSVAPSTPVAVIVSVAGSRRGTIFVHAFAIDYRVGSHRYRAVYPVGIKACVQLPSCPA